MKRFRGGLLALSALTMFGAADIAAQNEAEAERGRRGMRRAESAEMIMSMRERLALTEEQIASLDVIRAERVEQRSMAQTDMAEMRSRLQAGQIRQSEMMAFTEDRRDGFAQSDGVQRQRLEAILDQTQLETLQQRRSEAQAFRRGLASARGQRGGARGARVMTRGRGWNRRNGSARGGRGFRRGGPPGTQPTPDSIGSSRPGGIIESR
jgi:hypothetical protein